MPIKNSLPDMLDITLPAALNFAAKHIEMGDQVFRTMAIVAYPPKVNAAFLSRLASIPGVTLSVHIEPTEAAALIRNINRAVGEYGGRLELGGNALTIQRLEQSLKDAQDLLRKLDQEQQQVFHVTALVFVTARDIPELNKRVRTLEGMLAASGIRIRLLMFRQEAGLRGIGPWMQLDNDIKDSFSRNMPAETVAAAYPFNVAGLNDGNGIILGRDKNNGLVMLDIWRREGDRTNSNMTILAKPGAGKSFAAKMLIMREFLMGSRIIVIDPEREYKDMCALLGGEWVCCGRNGRINPLRVRSIPGEDDTVVETASVSLHLRTLRTFFGLYLKDLNDLEKALLEDALIETYAVYAKEHGNNVYPTIKHLHKHLSDKAENEGSNSVYSRLAVLLRRAADGADSELWAIDEPEGKGSDFTVLDIYDLKDAEESVRRAQYFNILSYAWSMVERDRSQKTILVVDEAWILADPHTPQAMAFLRDTSKRIRKYMGSLIVISQNVIDFLAPEIQRHGQAILDNPSYKLLLAQGEKDRQILTGLMNLSESEEEFLMTANRGEGLLVAGSQRIRVKIEAAPYEMQYLTGGGR